MPHKRSLSLPIPGLARRWWSPEARRPLA